MGLCKVSLRRPLVLVSIMGFTVTCLVWLVQAVPIDSATQRLSSDTSARRKARTVVDNVNGGPIQPTLTVRQFSDTDGLRSRQFETSVDSHRATSLAMNNDQTGMYVAGTMTITHSDSLSNQVVGSSQDAFLMFVSESNFEPQWVHQFGNLGDDFFGDVVVSNAGDVYAFGWTRSTFSSSPNPNAGEKDCLIVKFSSSGQVQAVRTFGSSGDDYITRAHYDPDANVLYVSGHMGGDERLPDFGLLDEGYPSGRGFLAKFDADLELVLGLYTGHGKHDVGTGIAFDGDGGFYFSFATFSPQGTVFSVVQKIDAKGNTMWTADTNSMTVAPAHGLSLWLDESVTPARPLVVLSGAIYANDAFKLSIIALRAEDGGLVEIVSGCCESGFAKASGGMVVTSGNYIVALGHHAEQQNGLGDKSPVLVSVTPMGHAVSKRLDKVSTDDHDVRMSHPIVLNGTIYFTSTKGSDFTMHAYEIAGAYDYTVEEDDIGGTLVNGSTGANAGSGTNPSGNPSGSSELGVGAIAGIIFGAAALALLLAGLFIMAMYRGKKEPERERYGVQPENPPTTPYDVVSQDDEEYGSRDSPPSVQSQENLTRENSHDRFEVPAGQSSENDDMNEGGDAVVYRYDPI